MAMNNTITDVPGIEVGHATNAEALTGCTVVMCREGAVGGVDVRGLAPGTRETDLLRPGKLVQQVHAVLLSGGSAYGLAAADGVMRYLEERRIGFKVGASVVPIVPAAILFDLAIGDAAVRPDAAMGYGACQAASTEAVAEGNVGAGTGATVGKVLGPKRCMKGGLGSASRKSGGVVVGAVVAVNAFGDVVDPLGGQIVAGARALQGGGFADTLRVMSSFIGRTALSLTNTVIGVVATNAKLSKAETNVVASMAHDGLARAIRPCHTLFDGDTIFSLSTGARRGNVGVVGALAAEAMAEAILRGVRAAKGVAGVPSIGDLAAPEES
jgi:L-aminopeptidase/D-esterase-like protein